MMKKKNKKGLITGLIVGGAIFSVSSLLIKRKRKNRLITSHKRPWWKKILNIK